MALKEKDYKAVNCPMCDVLAIDREAFRQLVKPYLFKCFRCKSGGIWMYWVGRGKGLNHEEAIESSDRIMALKIKQY